MGMLFAVAAGNAGAAACAGCKVDRHVPLGSVVSPFLHEASSLFFFGRIFARVIHTFCVLIRLVFDVFLRVASRSGTDVHSGLRLP